MDQTVAIIFDYFDLTSISAGLLAGAAASVFAAALLRGLTGFGFAIAAVPLLSLFFAPAFAVPLVICLQLFGNLFEIRASLKQCHWPSLRRLFFGAIIGIPAGVLALSLISADAARVMIAAVTAIAVLVLTGGYSLRGMPGWRLTVPVGAVAGIFNGLAAMSGPPVIAYYLASPVSRPQMRASLNVFFLASAIAALASAFAVGLLTARIVVYTVVMLPLMFLGQHIGLKFFHLGSDRTHRIVAIVCLAVLAAGAAIKGISGLRS